MDFNGLKDKLLSTLGQAGDSAKDLAGRAADSAKSLAGTAADKAKSGTRIARLSMEAASEREEIKKTYQEIGKLYYDTHKDDPEGFFVQLFEEIRIAEEGIASKEAEIAALKEDFKGAGDEISVDFEEVVDKAEAEAAGEAAEQIKENLDE